MATGKLAILLGAAGVNVTDDRNAGFEEVLEAEAAAGNHNIEIVAEQTANYVREKGQTVTEQLITANPDINLHLRPQRRDGARCRGRAQGRRLPAR